MRDDPGMTMIGRTREFGDVLAAVRDPRTDVVLVTGEAGVGKTRLLDAVSTALPAVRAWGTRGLAHVPLAALAHLLDPATTSLAKMVAQVLDAVPAGAVLAVDDLDGCDEVSLAVAVRVARDAGRTLVGTVRTVDGRVPPAVAELAASPSTVLLPVAAFDRASTEELVDALLDGPVDAGVVDDVWRRTGGNALFVTQLLDGARRSGALHRSAVGWHAAGPLPVPTGLRSLLPTRLEGLPDDAVAAARFLAATGRATDGEVELAGHHAGTERLVAHGIAVWAGETARFVHPLFAEVLWDGLSPARRRAVLREHLAVARTLAPHDHVRCTVLSLDAGEAVEPERLLAAARVAAAGGATDIAERLARACLGAIPGAALVLAVTLWETGRADEAVTVLRDALDRTPPGPDSALLAVTLHKVVLWGRYDLPAAREVLRQQSARYPAGAPVGALFAVAEADALAYAGFPDEALAIAAVIGDGARLPLPVRAMLATSRSNALAHIGRTGEAVAVVEELLDRVTGAGPEADAGTRDKLLVYASHALREHGRLDDAARAAERAYEGARADGVVFERAWAAVCVGAARLQAGHLDDAARWARRSLVTAAAAGMTDCTRVSLSVLAVSYGCRGLAPDPAWVAHLRSPEAGLGFLRHTVPIALGWAAYAEGRHAEARDALRQGQAQAARERAVAAESWILHERLRMHDGAGVLARLTALAVDSPIGVARLSLATGLDRASSEILLEAAAAFRAAGSPLYAAEAAAMAARCASGRVAAAARRRAAEFAHEVGDPATPPLAGAPTPTDPLTARERLVAELAAGGANNAEIAARLVLSVRTVENHLSRAYAKLGITSRSELSI
ncbi:DNA-binding NarL/FixJ family response regulator [Actinoplanes tereljensis]|uniref:Transcriptional regulator n=1 Tax=Paractinoplanes tereljensis TaxID=571912 RepID=A0A919NTQ6_9ACTN|nr:helix-turn-helix transcriptional regulator [Actinoplanes tereljensis]GIF23612.1 transcriptional regulator [Actinoplanes tereljensis]